MKFAGLIFWAAKCNGSCPHTETHGDHGIREFNRAFGILMLKIKDRDLQIGQNAKICQISIIGALALEQIGAPHHTTSTGQTHDLTKLPIVSKYTPHNYHDIFFL